jgi:hypothetical protein
MDNLIGWVIVAELAVVMIGMVIGHFQSILNTEGLMRNQIAIDARLEALGKTVDQRLSAIESALRPVASYYSDLQERARDSE